MSTRIVMLPGLGGDARLFGPQLDAFDAATVPAWIGPKTRESLRDYALRFAEQAVCPGEGEDWVAIGFSFGGMVALEMANQLPPGRQPRRVGLISGLRSPRAITAAFRMQVAIGTRIPEMLATPVIRGPLTSAFAKRCGLDGPQTQELRAMADDLDWDFLRWAARACTRWGFDEPGDVGVSWLHGERDRIVPYVPHPACDDRLKIIDDGSHLLTWTRPGVVNEWIAGMLRDES